jgi:Bacterial regulatory proteins, tetR family
MSGSATLERPETLTAEDDSVKRRQIIEGARAVFLAQGFDAASMNDIARAAGSGVAARGKKIAGVRGDNLLHALFHCGEVANNGPPVLSLIRRASLWIKDG